MSVRILGAEWVTLRSGQTLGFVVTQNEAGERKIYLGAGEGNDEGEDVDMIAENGSKILPDALKRILKWQEGKTE